MKTKAFITIAAETGFDAKKLRSLAIEVGIPVTIAVPTAAHVVNYSCHSEKEFITTKRSVVTKANEKKLLKVIRLVKSLTAPAPVAV